MRFAHYSFQAPNGLIIVTPLGKLITEEEYREAYVTALDWPCAWRDQSKYPPCPNSETVLEMYDELEANHVISSLVSIEGIAFVFLLSYLIQQITSISPRLAHAMGRSLIRFTNYSCFAPSYLEISAEAGDPDDAYYVSRYYRERWGTSNNDTDKVVYLHFARICAEKGEGKLNAKIYHYAYQEALYDTDKESWATSFAYELIEDLRSCKDKDDMFLPLSLFLRILAETKVDYGPDYKKIERLVLRSGFNSVEKASLCYWLGKCRLSGINGKRDLGRAEMYFRIAMDEHPSMLEKAGLVLAKMYYDGTTYDGVIDYEEALAIGEAVEARVGRTGKQLTDFVQRCKDNLRDQRLQRFISLLAQEKVTIKDSSRVIACLARHLEDEEFAYLMTCFIRRGYDEEQHKAIFEKLAYPPKLKGILKECEPYFLSKDES